MTAFTARALALAVHCLRRASWVRELAGAESWLSCGVDAEARVLGHVPGWHRPILPLLKVPALRALLLGAIERRVPGTMHRVLCRKLWFFGEATRALAGGDTRSVVILGAGLDPLGLRLCERFPDVRVLELDRSATATIKRQSLPHPRLRCAGGEGFAQRLPRPTASTLVLAEGVLMYLEPAEIDRLLDRIAAFEGPVRFAFSYLHPARLADSRSPIRRLARSLERRGERFAWSIEPDDLRERLANRGMILRETLDASTLHANLLHRRAPRRSYGEWLAIAERDA